MTEETYRLTEHLVNELHAGRLGPNQARALFTGRMAKLKAQVLSDRRQRRLGQGMCRPGWTGDMWKSPHWH
jgi:hypothetical protein